MGQKCFDGGGEVCLKSNTKVGVGLQTSTGPRPRPLTSKVALVHKPRTCWPVEASKGRRSGSTRFTVAMHQRRTSLWTDRVVVELGLTNEEGG
jgi:ApbE superfamily uncharacterized protein (UPF0280 family)